MTVNAIARPLSKAMCAWFHRKLCRGTVYNSNDKMMRLHTNVNHISSSCRILCDNIAVGQHEAAVPPYHENIGVVLFTNEVHQLLCSKRNTLFLLPRLVQKKPTSGTLSLLQDASRILCGLGH